MTILEQLSEYAKERVARAKENTALMEIRERAYMLPKGDFSFEKALKKSGLSFICECKKASPSKGLIAEDFPYVEIAKEYETAGADCISILTEPRCFLGKDEYLKEIAECVTIPCIRKDFIVDEYMIYEAKLFGASAVLLICSILTEKEIADYIEICDSLGLSALIEVHNEWEVKTAIKAGARIVGVNNRNLKDFTVDVNNSKKLRSLVPREILFVAESGVKTRTDIEALQTIGADAVLIGEALMKAKDKAVMLRKLRGVL